MLWMVPTVQIQTLEAAEAKEERRRRGDTGIKIAVDLCTFRTYNSILTSEKKNIKSKIYLSLLEIYFDSYLCDQYKI